MRPVAGAQADALQLRAAVRPLKEDVVGNVGQVLWVLLGSISLLLLIACANVANLVLVRAETRGTELALRTALGAGPGRLARGLMVESLTLEPDRRADRRRARLRRPAGPAGFPAGELAAAERDHDRSAGAWLCRGRLGPFGIAVRASADPASRGAAVVESRGGRSRRGAMGECRQEPVSLAERVGRGSGRPGPRHAGQLRLDDSHVSEPA